MSKYKHVMVVVDTAVATKQTIWRRNGKVYLKRKKKQYSEQRTSERFHTVSHRYENRLYAGYFALETQHNCFEDAMKMDFHRLTCTSQTIHVYDSYLRLTSIEWRTIKYRIISHFRGHLRYSRFFIRKLLNIYHYALGSKTKIFLKNLN